MSCVSTLTDEEFNTLITESLARQSRPVTSLDPRARRWSTACPDHGFYIGLFQVKDDACLCACDQSEEHCEHCIPVDRALRVNYSPTESDKVLVRDLSSPA